MPLRPTPARLLAVSLALPLLVACGTAPWQQQSTASPGAPGVEASASASPSASPSPTAPKERNDLAKGSLKRKLSAGGVTLSLAYYSTLPMDAWTPAATKPLTVAVAGTFGDESKQDIFLTSVTVAVDVRGEDGPLTSPAPLVDTSQVTPGYLIKSPSSYSQVFSLPTLPPEATSVTLNLTYQVLTPSAPKSKTYLKQSTGDSLVIALAGS